MNQSAFYNLSYGVYICSAWDEGRPTGCVANSAMQVTAAPATVAVSINRENYTHKCIGDCGYFAITVLSEKVDPRLIGKFGFFSGRDKDKFEGVTRSAENFPFPTTAAPISSVRSKIKWRHLRTRCFWAK